MLGVAGIGLLGALAGWMLGAGLSSLDRFGVGEGGDVADPDQVLPRFSRTVTFTPALTEIVFAIGAGARVVGRGSFVTYPPEALDLPVVGGIVDPNLEVIRALQPDLVLTQGDVPRLDELCRRIGTRLVVFDIETVASIYGAIDEIGSLLEREASARVLRHQIALELARVEEAAAARPRTPVFICVGRQLGSASRLWTVGPGSFLNEVIGLAGGDNVFGDLHTSYQEVSGEAVVRRAPRRVLDMMPLGAEPGSAEASVWERLFQSSTPSVTVIAGDHVLYPGPRVTRVARQVLDALAGG